MTKKVKKEVQVLVLDTKIDSLGSLKVVKAGYARNYLFPQKKARLASLTDIQLFQRRKLQQEIEEKQRIEQCLRDKKTLESNETYLLPKKTGENNRIFGKVTVKQVKEKLEEKTGLNLGQARIEIPDIKQLGNFPIVVQLHPTVKAFVSLEIVIP